MPGHQRIFVVSTTASDAELQALRDDVGRRPVVLTAPSDEAPRVVRTFQVEPRVELLLAPRSYPGADRGHQLDALVREHALRDRFRDVVVVTDAASSTLLLRVLAPDQLPSGGAVTVVGLPRGDRPVELRQSVVSGLALGFGANLVQPVLTLPIAGALCGLALMLVPATRHVGRELLLGAGIALVIVFLVVAGSARFPGAW